MQLRRDQFQNSISPLRELYGARGNLLIAPLDLCIMQASGGGEQLSLPGVAGLYDGASVVDGGGGGIGALQSYDWPPANSFSVQPFALIQPANGVDPSAIPDGRAPQAQVNVHDVVALAVLADDLSVRVLLRGTLSDTVGVRLYPDLGHRTPAYVVRFGQRLLGENHGSRILVDGSGDLLGMLIATQNQADGSCDALVFPAHLF